MNFKKFSKGLLALALATTMALSAPMAVFANATTISAEITDQEWESFVKEVVGLFNGATSKDALVGEINILSGAIEGESQLEMLYKYSESDVQEILNRYKLDFESVKTAVGIFVGRELGVSDLTEEKLINKLNSNKSVIKEKLDAHNLSVGKVKEQLNIFNAASTIIKGIDSQFLTYEETNFKIKEDKLKGFLEVITAAGKLPGMKAEILELITYDNVARYVDKINEKATPAMKADMLELANAYGLIVDKQDGGGSTGGSGGGGGGGGASTSPSKEAQKDITASLADLTKKDAKVASITEKILKDISKLDAAGAKAVAGPIITGMMDVIKKAETPANINDAKDAMVTLVQALVSKVTTQDVEVKDGAVTLSASKVKEQLKDATDMIKQLTAAAEKNNVELTKTVKVTLSYELDKEVTDVAVSIPEGLWSAIDKKANIAVRAKGIELVLEHNTFAEQVYTINVAAQEGNIFELTTEATFVQPIAVTFAVDKAVKNYPTVFQVLEGKNEVIGGVLNAQAETIKAFLSHFSFYTVGQGEPKAFTDISDLTWEKEAVQELSARGYIAGMSETSFAPRANITRAEFAAMLTRVVPNIEVPGKVGFADVKQGAWYYNSIVTAVNQGWLVGRDNNKFDPAAPVTRQEVAAVLSRVLEQKGYLQTADDVEGLNVAPWAKDAVSLYLREVDTKEVLALDMKDSATRAEVAVMIYELLSK